MFQREVRAKEGGYEAQLTPLVVAFYVLNIPAKELLDLWRHELETHALGCLGFPLPFGQLVVVRVSTPLVQRFPLGVLPPRLEFAAPLLALRLLAVGVAVFP